MFILNICTSFLSLTDKSNQWTTLSITAHSRPVVLKLWSPDQQPGASLRNLREMPVHEPTSDLEDL